MKIILSDHGKVAQLPKGKVIELVFREMVMQKAEYWGDYSDIPTVLEVYNQISKSSLDLWRLGRFIDSTGMMEIDIIYYPYEQKAFCFIGPANSIIDGYNEFVFNVINVPFMNWLTDPSTYKKIFNKLAKNKSARAWRNYIRKQCEAKKARGFYVDIDKFDYLTFEECGTVDAIGNMAHIHQIDNALVNIEIK